VRENTTLFHDSLWYNTLLNRNCEPESPPEGTGQVYIRFIRALMRQEIHTHDIGRLDDLRG
jgi:hypothetical protein